MNKFTFHYMNDVYWVTIPIYICIHLSNGALFGECISRKKLLSFFISKLTNFHLKIEISCGLEWWYRSDEAGRYTSQLTTTQCCTCARRECWPLCSCSTWTPATWVGACIFCSNHRGAREEPQDHALIDFELYPGYATEGPAFGGMP